VLASREVSTFFLLWQVPIVVAGLVAAVCIAAALGSLWRLAKLEAGMVFKLALRPSTAKAFARAKSQAQRESRSCEDWICRLTAADRDKPSAPIVIPMTGSGQATTSKLGNAYITCTGSQSFTTTQLGSSTVTRASEGNSWSTTKFGGSYVTCGPNGQQQTTTKLGNFYITRDSKTGSTLTTSPLGNSLQTRSNSCASWSTSPLGSSIVTRGSSPPAKKDDKATRVIVIPGSK
jgi:hypothetical protein